MLDGLERRDRRPELMDRPDLPTPALHGALDGLRRVNRVTGTGRAFRRELAAAAARKPGRRLAVADLGCGGGDVLIDLIAWAGRAGIDAAGTGLDASPRALAYAQARAAGAGLGARLDFRQCDVAAGALPETYDVVISTLFLHHLDAAPAARCLAAAAAAARDRVLILDLRRGRLSYLFAAGGVRALACNRVCRSDAGTSVRAAFTRAEVLELAAHAGLDGAQIRANAPFRFLLRWVRA
jgi:SAM-dependent methyltransferase